MPNAAETGTRRGSEKREPGSTSNARGKGSKSGAGAPWAGRAALAVALSLCALLPAPGATRAAPDAQGMPFRLIEATIDDIHGAFRAGRLTCRQLVQHYANRIEAYDKVGPALNSVQMMNPKALEEADRLDARFLASGPAGPLHCVPMLVKDQVETSDMPTTYGSAVFKDFVPQRDATVVTKLKAAGALILAKNTMGEFASGYSGSSFGVCRNPYALDRTPSGSSCGTGVGVAANLGAAGLGEDTGGSIRGPAASNSLVGLRPTLPLVSRFGMMPATPTRDTLGPMTRTVKDTAILLDALAGYDPNDPVTAAAYGNVPVTYTSFLLANGLRGARIGVIREPMNDNTDTSSPEYAAVRPVTDAALGRLAAAGAEVIDAVTIADLAALRRATGGSFETETAINAYLAEHPNAPVKTLQALVLSEDVLPRRRVGLVSSLGRTTRDAGYLPQVTAREALRQAVLKTMADNRLDALVYATSDYPPALVPADYLTAESTPPTGGSNTGLSPLLGYPALTVPAGFTADGLPVGLEFLGRPFAEGTLLKLGYAFEQASRSRRAPGTTPALAGEP